MRNLPAMTVLAKCSKHRNVQLHVGTKVVCPDKSFIFPISRRKLENSHIKGAAS